MRTWTGTYASGWHATVRAESLPEARRRLRITGRGERCTVTAGGTYTVWGRDEDDDYTEGE